jgi:CIC family chloride channel protein
MTGNFPATIGVLAGVLVSSAITRYSFGYSYSTWRFHLRGLRILGAHDIGWVRDITVGSIQRTGMKTVLSDMSLAEMRQAYPPGSAKRLFVVDAEGHYKGVIDVAALYDAALNREDPGITAATLAKGADRTLLPSQDVRSALRTFAQGELEVLPVVSSADNPRLIGYVTEVYALWRYNLALEAHGLGCWKS